MKKQNGYTAVELMIGVWLLVVLVGGFGWVWNIVKIAAVCCDPLTGMLILRIAGIFVPPLGAIVGFF